MFPADLLLFVLRPSFAPQAPLPPNTATSHPRLVHPPVALLCGVNTSPTFGIAALTRARAPQADREMASPFTPGKRSGTKGAAGGITTSGRGWGS